MSTRTHFEKEAKGNLEWPNAYMQIDLQLYSKTNKVSIIRYYYDYFLMVPYLRTSAAEAIAQVPVRGIN